MKSKFTLLFPLCVYVVIVHVLYLMYYDITFANSYKGYLLVYNFNLGKYFFSIFETIIITLITYRKLRTSELTNITLGLIFLLYFIPGVVQAAVINESWGYIMSNFLFFLCLNFWSKFIKPFKNLLIKQAVRVTYPHRYLYFLFFIIVLLTILLLRLSNTTFSILTLIETFADVYGVRADAKAHQMHWIILNIEYWVAYFIIFLVPFIVKRRNWIVLGVLIICELGLFLIQANRIFVFLLILAIIMSFINIDNKKLCCCFAILGLLLYTEALIMDEGLFATDIFRRFTIVPNRINAFYYDYFISNRPDFLTSHYDRFFTIMGFDSIYEDNPIGVVIGEKYFGWTVNCNTGMLGGNMYNWGLPAIVISTFGYVCSYRIFEMFSTNIQQSKYVLAMILATLSINSSALLANIFSISYFALFLLSLIPLLKSKSI